MTSKTVKSQHDPAKKDKKSMSSPQSGTAGNGQPFNFVDYFKGVRQEWAKITWPGREQVIAETLVVLVVVSLFSLFVYLVDLLFTFSFDLIT